MDIGGIYLPFITKQLKVDLAKKNLFPRLIAKQGDSGSRFLNIQLLSEGVDFEVSADAKVLINAERPDGKCDSFDGMVKGDGMVVVPLTAWMLSVVGVVTCDVSVVEGEDNRLTTMTFLVEVQGASYAGTDISQEE